MKLTKLVYILPPTKRGIITFFSRGYCIINMAKVEQMAPNAEFAAPWKNSDIVLVVGDMEFHVHSGILCFQSPVFNAMLNGAFKESKQDKITLQGKDALEMCNFLKLLYPSKTFEKTLNEENVSKMLCLADEFQAETVIKYCFDEYAITANNALGILPYASKYDQTRYHECVKVAKRLIKCENLKESIRDLEPSVREEILMGKCELLEDSLLMARDNLVACMNKLSLPKESRLTTAAVCCFAHDVRIQQLRKARECKACLVAYRAKFCDIVPVAVGTMNYSASNKKNTRLLVLLQDIDDLLNQRDEDQSQ